MNFLIWDSHILIYILSLIFNATVIFQASLSAEFLVYYSTILIGIYLYYEIKLLNKSSKPNNNSLFISTIIIIFLLVKGFYSLSDEDLYIYLSLPLLTLALFLLNNRLSDILKHKYLFLMTFLLPLRNIFIITFDPIFVKITSSLTWALVNLLGISLIKEDNILYVNKTGIIVEAGCSGASSIFFLLTLSIILIICYPLKNNTKKINLLLISFFCGLIENVIRISFLVYLIIKNTPKSETLFEFFHNSTGSLVFNSFSAFIICFYYLNLISKNKIYYENL